MPGASQQTVNSAVVPELGAIYIFSPPRHEKKRLDHPHFLIEMIVKFHLAGMLSLESPHSLLIPLLSPRRPLQSSWLQHSGNMVLLFSFQRSAVVIADSLHPEECQKTTPSSSAFVMLKALWSPFLRILGSGCCNSLSIALNDSPWTLLDFVLFPFLQRASLQFQKFSVSCF